VVRYAVVRYAVVRYAVVRHTAIRPQGKVQVQLQRPEAEDLAVPDVGNPPDWPAHAAVS
jgi:hypothetical protein